MLGIPSPVRLAAHVASNAQLLDDVVASLVERCFDDGVELRELVQVELTSSSLQPLVLAPHLYAKLVATLMRVMLHGERGDFIEVLYALQKLGALGVSSPFRDVEKLHQAQPAPCLFHPLALCILLCVLSWVRLQLCQRQFFVEGSPVGC